MTPHLYTRQEWDAMTRAQRRLVRAHRRRAVEWAQVEHERRYPQRGYQRLVDLTRAMKGNTHAQDL